MTSGTLPLATYHRASHLGAGTFGSVVCVYNDDGQEFALKLFLDEEDGDDDDDRYRYNNNDDDDDDDDDGSSYRVKKPINLGTLREISCLRLLRGANKHENIVELKDVQTDWNDDEGGGGGGGAGTSGCWGMALPLGKHGSLAGAIEKRTFTGYPKSVKIQLAHGLLAAVAFLHDNGILHRDIKCDNILLERVDHDDDDDDATNATTWKPILIDFSLAKPVDGTMWSSDPSSRGGDGSSDDDDDQLDFRQHTGDVGTLIYTAPEIASQVGYGKPADLYSVGVVLIELLRGALFTAEKAKEAAAQIASAVEALPTATVTVTTVKASPLFPDLIRKLLEQEPEDRITARQALAHQVFDKFGLATAAAPPERRIVNVATALPYNDFDDDDEGDDDNAGENESPNNNPVKAAPPAVVVASANTKMNQKNKKKIERRLKTIDKLLHELDSDHPWTRWAALEYSLQLEQLDDEMDDIRNSQSLADCCVLAHRFFELDLLDLNHLEQRRTGPFAGWNLDEYLDNEATIFMTLDYCLYPRKLSME